jgi:hypothetical protein
LADKNYIPETATWKVAGTKQARGLLHYIQFENELGVGPVAEVRRQLRQLTAVKSSEGFVEDFSQREQIGLRCAGAFGREITFRADNRARVAGIGHQADVRQLGAAIDENHVGRFHVAVHQTVIVQVGKRFGEREADFQHARGGEAAVREIGAEGVGGVE